MNVKQLLKEYEEEKSKLDAQIAMCKHRQAIVDEIVKELSAKIVAELGPKAPKAEKAPKAPKAPKAEKAPATSTADAAPKPEKKPRVKREPGEFKLMPSDNAILQAIREAPEPMSAGDVIETASKLSGKQGNTLRTRLSLLKSAGYVKAVKVEGVRGGVYSLGDKAASVETGASVVPEAQEPAQADPQADPIPVEA